MFTQFHCHGKTKGTLRGWLTNNSIKTDISVSEVVEQRVRVLLIQSHYLVLYYIIILKMNHFLW